MPCSTGDLEETLAADDVSPPRRDAVVERGTTIGRYVVLSRLGAGAMGVVYAAYDPELDRKVALKLLRSEGCTSPAGSDDRTRLLREAQALAKLSHPNVVTIYDVGTRDDRVWIAMEFVEGRTLGTWMAEAPRRWQEIVEVIACAGRGLAAAHAAGVLHRDFKPDNVMLGVDGRVRVMDFGLARTEADDGSPSEPEPPPPPEHSLSHSSALSLQMTRPGAMLGTPAYMAPEQMQGRADARSDQFSLSATLWEALYGERPFAGESLAELIGAVLRGELRPPPRGRRAPGWLRRVCARGLATDPESRFADVDALLAALERGRAQRRRVAGLAVVGVLAGLAVGMEAMRRGDRARTIATCEGEGAVIDQDWNDLARERVRQGLLATGSIQAETTANNVMPWLDAYADAWRTHRTEACLRARVHEQWTPAMLERSQWCLEERRLALVSLVDQLDRADAQRLHAAIPAAAGLPPSSPCLERTVLDNLPPPPGSADRAELAQLLAATAEIEALGAVGRFHEALERIRGIRDRVERLGWPPLVARLWWSKGQQLHAAAAYDEAERAYADAYVTAAKAGAWDVASSAAAGQVHLVGYRRARFDEGRLWSRLGELAVSLAGDPLGLREAERLGSLAAVVFVEGSFEEARQLSRRALELTEAALGDEHPSTVNRVARLAMCEHRLGRHVEALHSFERALAAQEQFLGPRHPAVADTLTNMGLVLVGMNRYAEARAVVERGLAIRKQVHHADHPDIATSLDALGRIAMNLDDLELARSCYTRALAIREARLGTEHPSFVGSLNNLANLHHRLGEREEALALYERALDILDETQSPDALLHASIVENLGNIRWALGQRERSLADYQRAVALLDGSLGDDHPELAKAWYLLGWTHAELGQTDEAIAAYERAVAIYDSMSRNGDPSDAVDGPKVRFWLAMLLVDAGRDRQPALALARQAREQLRARHTRGDQALRAKVDTWLATHDRSE